MRIKLLFAAIFMLSFSAFINAEYYTRVTISSNWMYAFFNDPALDNDGQLQISSGSGISYVYAYQGNNSFECSIKIEENEVLHDDIRLLARTLDGLYDLRVHKSGDKCTQINFSTYRPN